MLGATAGPAIRMSPYCPCQAPPTAVPPGPARMPRDDRLRRRRPASSPSRARPAGADGRSWTCPSRRIAGPDGGPASSGGRSGARCRACAIRAGSWRSLLLSLVFAVVAAGLIARGEAAGADARAYWAGVRIWLNGGNPYTRPARSCRTSTPRGCCRCSRRGRSCRGTSPGSSGAAGRSCSCSGRSTGRIAAGR